MPKLIASCFGSDPKWSRLSDVLRYTASIHCPTWDICIDNIEPAAYKSALNRQSYVDNTQKMEHWATAVDRSLDGDELLLIDSDTAIINPLDSIWSQDFDVAYTVREACKFPFNSGVVFIRVNPTSRRFISTWWQENLRLLTNKKEHQTWRAAFGGINQAALGSALTQHKLGGINFLKVPCSEWNCEDYSWSSFDPKTTKILHIKGNLRRAIFDKHRPHSISTLKLAKKWKQLETEAITA